MLVNLLRKAYYIYIGLKWHQTKFLPIRCFSISNKLLKYDTKETSV